MVSLHVDTIVGRSAHEQLEGRLFLGVGKFLPHVDQLDAKRGGVKVTGGAAARSASQVVEASELPVLFDREVYGDYEASPTDPFQLQSEGLFEQTLESALEEQHALGLSLSLTPTGHLPPSSEALETAIRRANTVEDQRVVVSLPLHHEWLCSDSAFSRLKTQLLECRHPVSISLAHDQDPLDEPQVAFRIRQLAGLSNPPFLDRTDFAGLDYLVHGGLAACIGVSGRLRHGQSPSIRGRRFSNTDSRTAVLWPGMLRFARPVYLDDLYLGLDGPNCPCPPCAGRSITSFTTSHRSQDRARLHNAWWITQLTREVMTPATKEERIDAWRLLVMAAIENHARLRADLDRPGFATPAAFDYWVW